MHTEDVNSNADTTDVNPGFAALNRAVDSLAAGLASLKENIPFYWDGKAAVNYNQILSDSLDITRLKELIHKLDGEMAMAKSLLVLQQGSSGEE